MNLLRRIQIDLSRDDLSFAIAETDSISSLAEYRGKSEPTFLFYGTGAVLVGVLRGCSAPKMKQMINTLLKNEDKVWNGGDLYSLCILSSFYFSPFRNFCVLLS